VFVASEPTILALANDGSRIYVASDTTNAVVPFSLQTMSPGPSFPVGRVNERVQDMEVAPGNAAALAVSRRSPGSSPSGAGLAVFLGGVQLPQVTSDIDTNNDIEFGATANILYGHTSESSTHDFKSYSVNLTPTGGLTPGFLVPNLLGSGANMEFDNGRMYFSNGQVVDPAVPAPLGRMNVIGRLEPDSSSGRTFFIADDIGKLKAFSQATFVPLGEITIPGFSGSAKKLISLDNGALAFATFDDRVFIFRGIPGDYDGNGTVGPSDFDVWKATYGSTTDLVADADGNNVVDAADYVLWRNNLGLTLTGGIDSGLSTAFSVPEPAAALLLVVGGIVLAWNARRALACG
jgi:hypothetical protein